MAADKEEIRDRNDIVEVIGTFVPLKQKGRNWLGLCPFHQEKTPSFNVTPLTQSFRCFGCGVKGDVFSFIEKYENMTFVEAAEFLARRVGLTFERKGQREEGTPAGERDLLYAINGAALAYFRKMLEKAGVARDYLYNTRGLAHDTIQRFQLGYAPEGWDNLTGYLQAQRHDLGLAVDAGLLHPGKTSDYYDVFRHRIVFPIHDEQERIVGFGGRAFGDEQPKYLNTGETPIFVKSRLLYGLPFARRKIAAEGKTLLMEGYMDVIAAHQAGFTNAVATLGTSLTEDHARKLARLAPQDPIVVLVYDADNAGIKATLRASEILEKEGVGVRVVRLPEGDDPDSLLKRGETARFQQAIDNAAGRVEYQLERIIAKADQTTDAGRAKMLLQIVHILATVPTRTERDIYIEKVWRYHPLSAQGPSIAKQQLHLDAEAYGAQRGRAGRGRAEPTGAPSAPPADSRAGAPAQAPGRSGQSGFSARQQRPWNREERAEFERRRFLQQVKPVPTSGDVRTAEQRAEEELIRALADPEWRASVLKHIAGEEFLTPLGQRFYAFVQENLATLGSDPSDLIRLLNSHIDEDFSSAVREKLQEFYRKVEKEAVSKALEEQLTQITGPLIQEWVRTLRRSRLERLRAGLNRLVQEPSLGDAERKRAMAGLSELARLLQRSAWTDEERESVREYQRLLQDSESSSAP